MSSLLDVRAFMGFSQLKRFPSIVDASSNKIMTIPLNGISTESVESPVSMSCIGSIEALS